MGHIGPEFAHAFIIATLTNAELTLSFHVHSSPSAKKKLNHGVVHLYMFVQSFLTGLVFFIFLFFYVFLLDALARPSYCRYIIMSMCSIHLSLVYLLAISLILSPFLYMRLLYITSMLGSYYRMHQNSYATLPPYYSGCIPYTCNRCAINSSIIVKYINLTQSFHYRLRGSLLYRNNSEV